MTWSGGLTNGIKTILITFEWLPMASSWFFSSASFVGNKDFLWFCEPLIEQVLNNMCGILFCMIANKLCQKLDEDFITPEMTDEWVSEVLPVKSYICSRFLQREMGLVCDFAEEIKKVYTAVFPSNEVMQKIIDDGAQDAMLFVHHAATWDIRNAPDVFLPMDADLLEKFKDRRVSVYNLHVPLDNYGKYSTSVTLAKALGFEIEKPFAKYRGALAGVFCQTGLKDANEMRNRFAFALGHRVGLYNYGAREINDGRVAVVAGGGNEVELLEEMCEAGIRQFLTGIAAKNDYSQKAHEFAQKNRINIFGGTHYSTEKFACISLLDYFSQMGLPAEFIQDKPVMEDL